MAVTLNLGCSFRLVDYKQLRKAWETPSFNLKRWLYIKFEHP